MTLGGIVLLIPDFELDARDEDVFAAFDMDYPGLEDVRACLESHDIHGAKKALVDYFGRRSNVRYFYDYRSLPLKKVDTDSNPYFFQSALGLQGSLKEFCMYVADRMLENVYVRPGKDRGEIFLGKDLDQMIHFSFLKDQGKRHRSCLDQFVRGQFFESLAIAYHETEDRKYLDKFSQMLRKFFETYPLNVVNGGPDSNRFQYDEDRDVMSVGWLCLVYISLFYTRAPYEIDPELAFEIIKRIWFLGIQFRRFDKDSYRAYNHHLFERGLVPFSLSVLMPEIPAFRAMRNRGISIVRRHVKEDFNRAGGYSEHSIGYWSGAALGEMLTRGIVLARINSVELLDKTSSERLNRSFSLLAKLATPGSNYPNIGDNKGPLIDPILNLGIMALDNSDCRNVLDYRQKGCSEALPEFDYANDESGFVISRNGFDSTSNYLLMSAKTKCGYTGHNHMDMLSVMLTIRGRNIIDEPYSGMLYHNIRMKSPQRGFMYNMSSHNTVLCYSRPVMDDMFYTNKWGVYRPDSPVVGSKSTERGFYAEALHTAYTFCLHRRKLFFSRNLGLIVHDRVERGNRYEMPHIQRWYLSIGATAERLSDNAVLIENGGVKVLMIAKEAREVRIYKNELLVPEIYRSEDDIAPVIDVMFQAPDRLIADNAPADLNTLFLDVTGKDVDRAKLDDACALFGLSDSLEVNLDAMESISSII